MTPKLFRILLASSLLSAALGSGIDYLFPNLVPQPLATALEAIEQPDWAVHPAFLWLIVVFLVVAGGASVIGLFRFSSWAPKLALAFSVILFILQPFSGVAVVSGLSMALNDLSASLWGAVLLAAFFSQVKEHFSNVPR
ncbi:MAG: hypothetical protein ABIG35_11885 [Pseudomonadota bacterium]